MLKYWGVGKGVRRNPRIRSSLCQVAERRISRHQNPLWAEVTSCVFAAYMFVRACSVACGPPQPRQNTNAQKSKLWSSFRDQPKTQNFCCLLPLGASSNADIRHDEWLPLYLGRNTPRANLSARALMLHRYRSFYPFPSRVAKLRGNPNALRLRIEPRSAVSSVSPNILPIIPGDGDRASRTRSVPMFLLESFGESSKLIMCDGSCASLVVADR